MIEYFIDYYYYFCNIVFTMSIEFELSIKNDRLQNMA